MQTNEEIDFLRYARSRVWKLTGFASSEVHNTHKHIYKYEYICMYICYYILYIHIYIERERDRDRERVEKVIDSR